MGLKRSLVAAVCLATLGNYAFAANYYVAPVGTTTSSGTGSSASPFASVNDALKSGKIQGGDTLLLQDGLHGPLQIGNYAYSSPVTIQSENGKNARFEYIVVNNGASNFTFRDLSIWPTVPSNTRAWLIQSYPGNTDIVIDGVEVRGASDASNYLSWTATDWNMRGGGARMGGDRNVVKNSVFRGIGNGVTTTGTDSLILDNEIEGYARDGMRALGDRTTIRGNRLLNCVDTSTNHDDGFQSWAEKNVAGATIYDLVIDGNSFIEWAASKSHPLRCRTQGIGMFDGFYENITIQNNLVAISQYHGISVYGGRNVLITNNTVINNDGINGTKSPWIGVFNHKNGTPSQNVVVANNVANKLVGSGSTANNIVFADNSIVIDHAATFEDIAAFDFTPAAGSQLIDSANKNHAAAADMFNNPRPHGNGPDKGAIEVGSSGGNAMPLPTIGGTTGGTTTSGGSTTTSGGTTSTSGGTTSTSGSTTTTPDDSGTSAGDTGSGTTTTEGGSASGGTTTEGGSTTGGTTTESGSTTGGTTTDTGTTTDSGTTTDGGTSTDSGTSTDGGSTSDGGTASDGGTTTDGGTSSGGGNGKGKVKDSSPGAKWLAAPGHTKR